MKHVAVKCRISKDDQKRGENVADQERWGRAYAAEHWPDLPVEVYCDNDISAADRRKTRPDFDRFCRNVAAGKVAHVVTTNLKRITRDAAQWFDLCDELFLPAGIVEIHTKHRGVMRADDLATDIDAVLGRRQIRETRQLILDKMENLALRGRPGGGRKYGYRSGRNETGEPTLEIVPAQADEIRLAAERVLSGWSLSNIVRDMHRREIPSTRGGRWDVSVLRAVLTKPTVAGLRVHHGEIIGKGNWDPILDETTWRLVCATLDSRATVQGIDGKTWTVPRKGRRQHPRRRWLLTGLMFCGRDGCGAKLAARHIGWGRGSADNAKPYYCCPTTPRGGCGRLGAVVGYWRPDGAYGVEGVVLGKMFDRLRNPEFLQKLANDDSAARRDALVKELGAVEVQRAELGRMWATKKIDAVGWQAARGELDALEADLSGRLAELPAPAGPVDADELVEDWAEMTLDEKRFVVERYVERIVIMPAKPGRRFDEDRVVIAWRESSAA